MIESLFPQAPFNFPGMLHRPLSRPSTITVVDSDASSYTRVLRLNTRAVPITIAGTGTVEHPELRLMYPDDVAAVEKAAVQEKVQRMFSTKINLNEFYATMRPMAQWPALIDRLYGLRPIQDADLFESMVKVIIGQQLNVQFAATLVERLVNLGGDVVEWNHLLLPVFPSPEQVAAWSTDDLRSRSFSQRKAEYVIDFARAVVDARVDLERLWEMTDDQIYEELVPLRGIGRWTVECFLLFGMGRPDVLPAADIGVQNAVHKLYGMEQRPKEDEVRQLAEPWSPWRSYATYYLWQSLIPTEALR